MRIPIRAQRKKPVLGIVERKPAVGPPFFANFPVQVKGAQHFGNGRQGRGIRVPVAHTREGPGYEIHGGTGLPAFVDAIGMAGVNGD